MALKMVKGSIDRMFDKNLQDLVRGIRNHKEDEVRGPFPALRPGDVTAVRWGRVWEGDVGLGRGKRESERGR